MMNNSFASNLKKIRKENNLSQEQLADKLGVSRQAISKWESASAYPEMDKILQICKMFDVNINDLLNNDIKEVKGEQETKNKISKYIDDFLNFITKTINMFTNFNFKTKIKFLFEQIVILAILIILFILVGSMCSYIFANLIRILPEKAYYIILGIFEDIFYVISIIIGLIVYLHIFKTRYLDYYDSLKGNIVIDIGKSIEKEEQKEFSKEKIIIRDPNHSGYRFIKGLLKLIVIFIKAFTFFIVIFFSISLLFLVMTLIFSFIILKTKFFFIGVFITLLGCILINLIFMLLLLNFIFDRKNAKKSMIWSFILGIFLAGIGCGICFLSFTKFKVVEIGDELIKSETIEIEMQNNLSIENNYFTSYEFIEKNIDNIKIEYETNKYCNINYDFIHDDETKRLHLTSNCDNFELSKEFINYFNNNKILYMRDFLNIKVYASKENIEKIKENNNKYMNY